jgi:hypothetical protein
MGSHRMTKHGATFCSQDGVLFSGKMPLPYVFGEYQNLNNNFSKKCCHLEILTHITSEFIFCFKN